MEDGINALVLSSESEIIIFDLILELQPKLLKSFERKLCIGGKLAKILLAKVIRKDSNAISGIRVASDTKSDCQNLL